MPSEVEWYHALPFVYDGKLLLFSPQGTLEGFTWVGEELHFHFRGESIPSAEFREHADSLLGLESSAQGNQCSTIPLECTDVSVQLSPHTRGFMYATLSGYGGLGGFPRVVPAFAALRRGQPWALLRNRFAVEYF